jgi:hypothetical protein
MSIISKLLVIHVENEPILRQRSVKGTSTVMMGCIFVCIWLVVGCMQHSLACYDAFMKKITGNTAIKTF